MEQTADVPQSKQSFVKKWLPLLVLGLAVLIIVIDTTLLNVSLGSIIRDLKTTLQSLQWVIAAYSLTLAALTITGGRLGDLFGRKKMFITGAIIFAGGSFLASISHSVGHLLIGESIIEGMGAALMMPATASLLIATYHGRDRAVADGDRQVLVGDVGMAEHDLDPARVQAAIVDGLSGNLQPCEPRHAGVGRRFLVER